MSQILTNHRVFWKEFWCNFHATGAILPSSRFLARALGRYVGAGTAPQRILEVGPGTGAVTARIVARMGTDDRLDLVELNSQFVERLNYRFAHELSFQAVANRSRVLHLPIEELAEPEGYDLVISGLPLNNFSVADVERILQVFHGLLRPGGTLSFFEYMAIRQMRSTLGRRDNRLRLSGISDLYRRLLSPHLVRRDWVWANVPPAWVHHVRWG